MPKLDDFMQLGGELFQIIREGESHEAEGLRNTEKSTKRKYVGFYLGTDVQTDDWLKGTVSGDEFHVLDVTRDVIHGRVFQVKAYYETKAEYMKRIASERAQLPTFNIGTAYGSIIGTQQSASLTAMFDFRRLEKEIEGRGGEDIGELKEMVMEIRNLLQQDEGVRKGALAKFSALLQRHSWNHRRHCGGSAGLGDRQSSDVRTVVTP